MRIIAGRWRSHRIVSAGRTVRPTTDRARQILFDILGPSVVGARVLDLFAGTGALGLEALSRGARFALFVDSDPRAIQGIRRTVSALDARESTGIWTRAVGPAVSELCRRGDRFDWILADPPYGKGEDLRLLQRLGGAARGLLAPEGGLVLEVPKEAGLPPAAGGLRLVRERTVGRSALRFYVCADRTEDDGEVEHEPEKED